MRAFVAENAKGDRPTPMPPARRSSTTSPTAYLRPRALAALYEAAATMSDLQAVKPVMDAAGRPGIGITWPSTRGSGEIVLVYPETCTFLGLGGPAGGSAVLALAIVDRVGHRA